MTVVGVVYALLMLAAAPRWFQALPWLLGLAIGLPASAAVQLGGQNVSAFALVSLVATATLLWRWVRPHPDDPTLGFPGALPLVVLLGWSLMITAVGPLLFSGVEVLSPRGGISNEVVDPSALTYTTSNLAQLVYLSLGVVVITYLAWARFVSPHCLTPGLLLCMLLSNWRLTADRLGVPYPTSIIDNSTSVKFVNQTATGEMRLRGVFSEPSGLGLYGVAAVVLALAVLPRVRGAWRASYVVLLASAGVNLAFAQSGTALVGGTVMLGLLGAAAVYLALASGRALMPVAIGLCFGVTLLLLLHDPVAAFFAGSVDDKVESSSFAIRSTADVLSWRLGFEAYGLGVGLGSNRPSSLWPMLWSCTGVVGTAAFAWFVMTVVRSGWRSATWAPHAWVVVSLLVCKSVAGSDLSIPLLIASAGLAARGGSRWAEVDRQVDERRAGDGSSPAPTTASHAVAGSRP